MVDTEGPGRGGKCGCSGDARPVCFKEWWRCFESDSRGYCDSRQASICLKKGLAKMVCSQNVKRREADLLAESGEE